MRGNQWIVLATLAILSLFVAACGSEPTPVPPTNTPTPAPPTHTATPVSPTAMPTPTLTPTPTPPSAHALLEAAFGALMADSYHFEMDIQMKVTEGNMTMELPFTFVGDFEAPDRVQGTVSMSMLGMTIEIEMITIGETAYATNLDTGEWEVSAESAAPFAPGDFTGMAPADIEDLAVVGEETLDGTPVYHLQGMASTQDMGPALAEIEGDLQLEYWIGVEDGRLRQYVVEGELAVLGLDSGTIGMTTTTTYSDYGQRVAIEPPELPPEPVYVSVEAESADLVLLPQWTSYTNANSLNDLLPLGDEVWAATDGGVLHWSLSDGAATKYLGEHGLASGVVQAVAMDEAGGLWFGTDRGLSRFAGTAASQGDGEDWVSYTTEDGLAGNQVNAIAVDSEGALWFGTDKGVSRFAGPPAGIGDGEGWTTYTAEDGLARGEVNTIFMDSEGALWFGTDKGVSRFDGQTWTTYGVEDGLVDSFVRAIAESADGALWFGTWQGVSRFDGESWTTTTWLDGLADDRVSTIAVDAEGALWFGTFGSGISRFDGERWTTYTTEDGLADDMVWAIDVDEDGALWFSTENGMSRFDGQAWTTYALEEGLDNNRVDAIAEDRDGALWFATWNARGGDSSSFGVSRFDGQDWTKYGPEDGLPPAPVWAIAVDGEGMAWFGTIGEGVGRYNGNNWATYTVEDGVAQNHVTALAVGGDDTLWVGTSRGGVSQFDGRTWTTHEPANGLTDGDVDAIAVAGDGALWFGTDGGGVSRFDGEALTAYTEEDGLTSNQVSAIAVDAEGVLWFGTSAGVSRFDGDSWTTYTVEDGLADNWVTDIAVDGEGVLWFATDPGVSRFDGQTWTTDTAGDGMVLEWVYAIEVDSEGALWFGTQDGVFRYQPLGGTIPSPVASAPPVAKPTQSPAQGIKVGLVTDVSGIDDASFNQNTWAGLQRAQEELGVQAQFIESQTQADYEKNITEFAEQHYDLVITVGYLLGEATARMAMVYPNTSMAIVDFHYEPPIPNVAGMVFNVDESAFPIGYLAAGWADLQDPDDPQVGWVGGMQIPPVEQFIVAYEAGVDYYNQQNGKSVQAKGVYVGDFRAPDQGKIEGQSLIDQGVDVIFGVGGKTGDGGLVAAKENGKWGIGVDVDQYYTLPNERDILLTSCVKRLDNAAYGVTEAMLNDEFPGGSVYVGTLNNDGVGLAPYHDLETQIPDELKQEVEAIIEGIKKGEIDTGW